jgi:hypothetical protein
MLARKTNEAPNGEPDASDAPDTSGCDHIEQQPFRFMNLPTELRLQIAEYVLVGSSKRMGEQLEWKWTRYDHDIIAGTFVNLDAITPFRLVSRQIYEETCGLVWKVNSLFFDVGRNERHFCKVHGIDKHWDGNIELMALTEAHQFFLRHIGTKSITLLRSIAVTVDFLYNDDHLDNLIQQLVAMAKSTPAAQVIVCSKQWVDNYLQDCVTYPKRSKEEHSNNQAKEYLSEGRRYQKLLSRLGYDNRADRNWRIFCNEGPLGYGKPNYYHCRRKVESGPKGFQPNDSEPEWFMVLDEAELATVREWKNGI